MKDLPSLPAEAREIVARAGIGRTQATRKLRDVLARAATGGAEVATIRTISVIGSYARGAPSVGDIDLVVDIDDPRDERTAQLNDLYARFRGENPRHRPLARAALLGLFHGQRHRRPQVRCQPGARCS